MLNETETAAVAVAHLALERLRLTAEQPDVSAEFGLQVAAVGLLAAQVALSMSILRRLAEGPNRPEWPAGPR